MDPTPPSYPKIYRSRKDRMIAGVCGGISARFHIDSSWVRILFLLFFFIGGAALLLYFIMWMLVPLAPE
jgi:phage shock protein C